MKGAEPVHPTTRILIKSTQNRVGLKIHPIINILGHYNKQIAWLTHSWLLKNKRKQKYVRVLQWSSQRKATGGGGWQGGGSGGGGSGRPTWKRG